ncbi:MAG: NAD-dependent epimerase/dehydratase family protein [Anaerolineaceae bacterium]|nr:NAD-dependent epimerase/dehydratase family protein [Anaerolineaceae bacterium]
MRNQVILITGINGEIGHGLARGLSKRSDTYVVGLDVAPLDKTLRPLCQQFIQGDILDNMLLGRLVAEYEIRTIFHLASILSTKAEYNPETGHRVNVEGTLNLLRLAVEQSQWQGRSVKFIYPSSIAVYWFPTLADKEKTGKVKEEDNCFPTTMYGCNKLYCELLGRYYANYYRQLAADQIKHTIDFRAIRFPGLISAETIPTGGTSDYGPEMLHHAAQNIPYHCFVREDSRLPFMAMPDAVKALLTLEAASNESLHRIVYNVTSFSPSALEIRDIVLNYFPDAAIDFIPHANRQQIVDTWPADVDDGAARHDWDWQPDYDQARAFSEYLVPSIKERYRDTA